MTVKELKQLINETFEGEEYDECEIVVPVNGYNMEIVGIDYHPHYSKPGQLPWELVIR